MQSRSLAVTVHLGATLLLALAGARPALAHWCDDVWGSSYNIVVKPATDTVSVPSSGAASLDIFVQNNMGYPLKNFSLAAQISGGHSVNVSRATPVVSNYLLPSEKLRYTLAISREGGAELAVEDIEFFVSFGDGSQSRRYGQDGEHVMMRKNDGTLHPSSAPGLGSGNDEALHLRYAAKADFGDLDDALDGLLQEYCAGRRSWDHSAVGVITLFCPDTSSTYCSFAGIGEDTTKWDWQKLWAVHELAYRKSALGSRAATLRERLQCGWDDPHLTFKAFAGFVLGYLGEDAGVRSFLEGTISGGNADEAAIAKAALLLMGDPADHAAYGADVVANLGSPTFQVSEVSAAVLGIVDGDDVVVRDYLIERAKMTCPGGCDWEGDGGVAMLASHLVSIVAWHSRGWAANAADTGAVSFYGEDAPDPSHDNNPPDCTTATVAPMEGSAPLTVQMDASGCTDPDGDGVAVLWRAPTSVTSEDTYNTASATHTFTEPGNVQVHLIVTDNGDPPAETSRDFFVTVFPEGSDGDRPGAAGDPHGLVGGCGCAVPLRPRGSDGARMLALLALVACSLRRRRG